MEMSLQQWNEMHSLATSQSVLSALKTLIDSEIQVLVTGFSDEPFSRRVIINPNNSDELTLSAE